MKKLTLIRLACTLFMSTAPTASFASDVTFSSVESFLSHEAGARVERQARGDLNGDGRADWVGSLRRPVDNQDVRQIYVLTQTTSGRYALAMKSHATVITSGTANDDFDQITLSGQSFYLSFSSSWQQCTVGSTTQVQWRNGSLQLIGFDYESALMNEAGKPQKTLSISRNLLTGSTIEIVTNNGKQIMVKKYKSSKEPRLLKDYDANGVDIDDGDSKNDPCY